MPAAPCESSGQEFPDVVPLDDRQVPLTTRDEH